MACGNTFPGKSMRALASIVAGVCLAGQAWAQPAPGAERDQSRPIDDGYGDAFLQYRPYVVPGTEQQERTHSRAVARPAAPAASAPTGPQLVDAEWLRRNLPLLQERAFNDPSEVNVAAKKYAVRVLMDKASRLAQMEAKVVAEDPLLNENNRVPYASAGAQAVSNANWSAQQSAVKELAAKGGLLIFVDGSCRFCTLQLPPLDAIHKTLGMEYLVVSTDSAAPKGYRGKVLPDNGLFRKIGLKLTPSIVYVPAPKAYTAASGDPNHYFVIAQGYYAQDELVKQIAFAGHSTQLLSPATMKDLDVWNRGVASIDDLSKLRLDPNDPAAFKAALQPLLLKQYK
jgi:conjugal transfer pilus assembly protein TraF